MVSSLAFGVILGGGATGALALATAAHPEAVPVVLVFGAVSIPGSATVFHLMRDDRGLDRTERLTREVNYPPALGATLRENWQWLLGSAVALAVILGL